MYYFVPPLPLTALICCKLLNYLANSQGESYEWVCITPGLKGIHLELQNSIFTDSKKEMEKSKVISVNTEIFKTMIENG